MDMDPAARVPVERLLEHRAWVQALARALVSDRNRADDVEQDAWLAALRHPPRHGDGLRAWLARLVRHRVSNARRGEARREVRERGAWEPPAIADPVGAVARIEAHERVVRAVLSLAEPYRTTIVLRFYEDLTSPQIAERMGVPVETVRTRTKRAMAQLRERFGAGDEGTSEAWTAALLPLAWSGGGAAMKAGTKTGLAAAAVLLLAGAGAWTWGRRTEARMVVPPPVVALAPSPKPVPLPQPVPATTPNAATATLFGEVWQRGPERPAAGVSVRLTSDGAADRSVVADARGRFRLADLPAGTRGVVRISADGSAAEPVAVPPLLASESRFVGVMWLATAMSADVVVTSIDGHPLSGARVAAFQRPVLSNHRSVLGTAWFDDDASSATWRDARDPAASATTDATGRASLGGLVAGNWHFLATAGGYAPASRVDAVAAGRATTVRLSLVPGLELTGRVEDRGGKPVAGLCVMAFAGERLEPNVAETMPRAATDADGRFVLRGLSDGRTVLWVARPGLAPVPVLDVRVPVAAPVTIVVGGAGMQGTVRDASTGAVVAAARVRAYVGLGGRIAWLDAVTDDAGAYDMDFLANRGVVDAVRVEGYSIVGSALPDRSRLLGSAFDVHGDTKVRLDLTVSGDVSILGRVTHDGQPVRGAAVRAFTMPSGSLLLADTSTDGDGRYELRGVNGLLAAVRVVAPPFAQPGFPYADLISYLRAGNLPPRWGVQVPSQGGATLDVDLADGADVAGRVVDPAGHPIEGAELVMGDSVIASAADGGFVFRGIDCEASSGVTASREGFVDAVVGLEPLPLTIRMTPCRFVRGTVRATDGVLVSAWVQYAPTYGAPENGGSAPPVDWERARRAPVAADGRFAFGSSFAFSRIAVRAGSRGHGPTEPIVVSLDGAGPLSDLTIDLAPSTALRGRVVAEDGAPIAGARIELDRATLDAWDDEGRVVVRKVDAVSDAAGRFEIASAIAGAHRLLAVADGYAATIVDAETTADEVVVRLPRVLAISGVVLRSDGRPLGNVSVTFFPRDAAEPGAWSGPNFHATVRPDGSFRSAAVPPGVYWARVAPRSTRVSFEAARFDDVAAGTTGARFVVDTTRGISGRVVGGDSAPVAGASIWFLKPGPAPGRLCVTALSDDDGTFEVLSLAGGDYTVDVRPPAAASSGLFVVGKRWLRARFPDVAAGTAGLELRLPLGAEIAGTLVDETGAPAAGRSVMAKPLSPRDPLGDVERPGALTGADGRFVVTGLAPGRYRLVEIAPMTMAATPLTSGEEVEAGAKGLRLSLPRTSAICGRIVDENDIPFAGVEVLVSGAGSKLSAVSGADGTFAVAGVPGSGTYTVEAKVNRRAPMRAVDVAPGATGVTIRLVRGLPVSGRLIDAAGKPVAPATLVFRTEHGEIEASAYADEKGRFTVSNLLPGVYRVEQMTSGGGGMVYLPRGTIRAGDEDVELRREP